MIRTRWPGRGPWDEVWFLESVAPDGSALWVRTTLTDGVDPAAEVWIVAEVDGRRHSAWRRLSLAQIRAGSDPLLEGPDVSWSPGRISGAAGDLRWDLRLVPRDAPDRLLPAVLDVLGVGRTYTPVWPSVEVQGEIAIGDTHHHLQLRGVLGHIHGRRSRLQRWGWTHASTFPDHDDVVVEVLAAELGGPLGWLGPLAAVRVQTHLGRFAFNDLSDLVRTHVAFDDDGFALRAHRDGARCHVRFDLADEVSLLRYRDAAGGTSWCRNSAHGTLRLTLDIPERGLHLDVSTPHAMGELAGRARPPGDVLLPPEPA